MGRSFSALDTFGPQVFVFFIGSKFLRKKFGKQVRPTIFPPHASALPPTIDLPPCRSRAAPPRPRPRPPFYPNHTLSSSRVRASAHVRCAPERLHSAATENATDGAQDATSQGSAGQARCVKEGRVMAHLHRRYQTKNVARRYLTPFKYSRCYYGRTNMCCSSMFSLTKSTRIGQVRGKRH